MRPAAAEWPNSRSRSLLDGDAVGDLARVMRLPGTSNPEPGGGACRLLSSDGPRYRLEEIAAELQPFIELADAVPPRISRRLEAPSGGEAEQEAPVKRGRGRPALGVTNRDLRTIPPWARALVVQGQLAFPDRYGSRSHADLAAVGAMVKAGWKDARIAAAFARSDWSIGARYRELRDGAGQDRACGYLDRTICVARGVATAELRAEDSLDERG